MNGTTPPFHRLFALATLGATLFSTIPTAEAVLIAGDSFFVGSGGYVNATNLTAQPAGGTSPNSFGFTGTYGLGATGFLQPVGGVSLNSTALGYSGATGGSIFMRSDSAINGQSRSLLRLIDGSASNPDTLYFSGLIRVDATIPTDRGGFFEFSNRTPVGEGATSLAAANEGFEFGIQGGAFVLRTFGGPVMESYSPASYTPLIGTTATNLFILRLQINAAGDDELTMYLNPTDVTTESRAIQTAAFSITLTDRDVASFGREISSFGFRTLGTSQSTVNIYGDEVRIGTTFTDVVTAVPPVVPEPALGTLVLAGVGVLAASRRRRTA